MAMRTEGLEAARAEHHGALAAFAGAAASVPDETWNQPMAPGKWTPAQVVEHVRSCYAVITLEIEGGSGLRMRTGTLMRTLLRATILRVILGSGRIPARAKAPRELRPGEGPFPKHELLDALAVAGSAFEERLASRWDVPGAQLTHHLFGKLPPRDAFRFVSVHNEHHRRQLADFLARRA